LLQEDQSGRSPNAAESDCALQDNRHFAARHGSTISGDRRAHWRPHLIARLRNLAPEDQHFGIEDM